MSVSRPALLDYALLLAVGVMWGAQFVLNDVAIRSFGPLTVGAGRLLFGALALTVIVTAYPANRPNETGGGEETTIKQPWRLYAVIALVEGVIPLVFIPWGQRTVDSAIAAILLALVPVFTLALTPLLNRDERWSLTSVISVVLGFAGIIVLLAPSVTGSVFHSLFGELIILFASACWALGILLMKRVPKISPFLAIRNIFALAALPLVPLALVVEQPWTGAISADSIYALLALGVFCGGIAYGLFLYIVMRTGPTFSSLVGYLVTLLGVFFGIAFMGDPFGGNDLIALALIAAALAVARRAQ